jgi:hypothetical protein
LAIELQVFEWVLVGEMGWMGHFILFGRLINNWNDKKYVWEFSSNSKKKYSGKSHTLSFSPNFKFEICQISFDVIKTEF